MVVACLLLGAGAHAQQSSGAATTRRDANVLLVRGRPTVLMWARGLDDTADLDTYVASGFNTAYVLISSSSDKDLAAASTLMTAVEAKSLFVVAAVTPSAIKDGDGGDMAPDPTSAAYAKAVSDLVAKLVNQFGKHTGLIGWSIEAIPPGQFPWSDSGFRAFLSGWYQGSLSRLNDSWDASFEDWDQVTYRGARDVDADRAAGLGRASIDVALYRRNAYADALDLWANALRAADPGRLILASALPDYRSIISVRNTFDGMVLNTYPNSAEQDFVTHNVHSVDIARRGNQFAAIPTFWIDSNADANRTANWMNEALLHGAAGLALSDWSVVRDSEDLQATVKLAADAFREGGDFPKTPLARAAILYDPIAGGAQRNGQGLYGYLDGVTPDEPTTLFAVARMGTRYGQIDVLSQDSLSQVNLQQYSVIFAPMALFMPDDVQVALNGFVLQGGALVVDAGAGMYQGDGTINSTPPMLSELLGMRYTEIAESNQPSELGSLGQPGEEGQPGVAIPVGPGEAGLEIDPDVAKFADILGQFLSRPDVRKYLGEDFVGDNGPGFRVRGLGRGFAVYAPTFLYDTWNAADPYFDDFHQRMLSWRYDLEVIQPDALWPSTIGATEYSDGSIGLVSPSSAAAIVDVYGGGNQAYQVPQGAVRYPNRGEQNRVELLFPGEPLATARPIPIYIRTPDEGAVVTVSIARYDAGGIEFLVNGDGATANATGDGIQVSGGALTNVEIEIHDGVYRLPSGSMHHVVVEGGLRGRQAEETIMPNPDTGYLVVSVPVRSARITVQPEPAG
jgi:hypothetical protein